MTDDEIQSLAIRIAKQLNWSLAQVQSFSLPALRDLVRPVNPTLANEISHVIQKAEHVAPRRRRRR
jgi:hypothetical protein